MAYTLSRESKHLDNTKISTFKECPRKYLLRHVMGWTTDYGTKAPALVFGSSWHAGMDAIWGAGPDASNHDRLEAALVNFGTQWEEDGYNLQLTLAEQEDLGARTPGIAHEMFFNYIIARERLLKECEVLAIEQPIAMPFPDLDDTWYVGKLDKVIRDNAVHILEHKTTGMYAIKGTFQPDYVESWATASQVKGYQMVGSVYHPDLQDVWVDAALVHKKIHDAFKFIPVSHHRDLLLEWIVDTKRWIMSISEQEQELAETGSLEKGTFRRNEDQCYGKYSKCAFLPICSTCSDPTKLAGPPPGYKVERWEPFDTLGLERLAKGDDE